MKYSKIAIIIAFLTLISVFTTAHGLSESSGSQESHHEDNKPAEDEELYEPRQFEVIAKSIVISLILTASGITVLKTFP